MTTPLNNVLAEPLRVRDLVLPNRVWLSPLAGVSDAPFRRICDELGAGLTYVEMLLSNSLRAGHHRSEQLLARHPAEARLGVQVTGPSAEAVAEAVGFLDTRNFDTIDINMGCPVRKIVARGAGSAILKDPSRVERTLALARARTTRPLSAKIRLGYTPETRNVEDTVRRLAAAGADVILIHGRTRDDDYQVPVDYTGIAAGVAAARAERGPAELAVVGNGDVFDADSAARMVARTGCDAVLVSRGALGNPWIFSQILDPAEPHPTPAEWRAVLLRHLDYHLAHYGGHPQAIAMFRKHLLWYVAGFPNMRRLRGLLATVNDPEEIISLVDRCLATIDPAQRRYAADQHPLGPFEARAFDPKYDMDRQADRAAADEPA